MDTFYYCALDENSKTCTKQNKCKRYTHKKGVPASEDANAKLFNICNDKYGYKLYMEDDEVKEDEKNDNQTEHAK